MEEKKNLAFLGVVFLLSLGALTYLITKIGKIGVGDYKTYYAVFENTKGLAEKSDVRLGGVKVGFVEDMEIQVDGKNVFVRVKMKIKPDIPIRKDFEAQIRAKSLLGEKYIELIPTGNGDISPAEEGFVIKKTRVLFEPDEFLLALRPVIEAMNPQVLAELSRITPELIKSIKPMIKNTNELIEKMNEIMPSMISITKRFMKMSDNLEKLLYIASENTESIQRSITMIPDTLTIMNDTFISMKGSMEMINSVIKATLNYQDSISRAIELSPQLLQETLTLVNFMNSMIPEFQKLLTQTSITLDELRKVLKKGVKVRFF